jgi:hypothetical protein
MDRNNVLDKKESAIQKGIENEKLYNELSNNVTKKSDNRLRNYILY